MSELHYGINAAVQRTGLSAHVIRIWERRYGAVEPERTSTKRRLYSDEQIERLNLLRALTQTGHSIGFIARLPTERLRKLSAGSPILEGGTSADPHGAPAEGAFFEECIAAVKAYDSRALEAALKRAENRLGAQGLLRRGIAPLVHAIGELWRDGTITAAQEHFASGVIRVFLADAAKPFARIESAPLLLVATPAGQLHELGALLVAAVAANLGWRVMYLGISLPAGEIAGAARQSRARAVALSLVYPEDDPYLGGELIRLRELLPQEVTLLAGGRAVPAYRDALERVGALQPADLDRFCSTLDELRKPAARAGR